jgi:hypothetical protein
MRVAICGGIPRFPKDPSDFVRQSLSCDGQSNPLRQAPLKATVDNFHFLQHRERARRDPFAWRPPWKGKILPETPRSYSGQARTGHQLNSQPLRSAASGRWTTTCKESTLPGVLESEMTQCGTRRCLGGTVTRAPGRRAVGKGLCFSPTNRPGLVFARIPRSS